MKNVLAEIDFKSIKYPHKIELDTWPEVHNLTTIAKDENEMRDRLSQVWGGILAELADQNPRVVINCSKTKTYIAILPPQKLIEENGAML